MVFPVEREKEMLEQASTQEPAPVKRRPGRPRKPKALAAPGSDPVVKAKKKEISVAIRDIFYKEFARALRRNPDMIQEHIGDRENPDNLQNFLRIMGSFAPKAPTIVNQQHTGEGGKGPIRVEVAFQNTWAGRVREVNGQEIMLPPENHTALAPADAKYAIRVEDVLDAREKAK